MLKTLRTKIARLQFGKGDPLRYQHVLASDRLDDDEPADGDGETIDLDWYRQHPDGLPSVGES